MSMCDRTDIFPLVEERLAARAPVRIFETRAPYRHAGVLVPLLRENGACKILLIKRTNRVETHKGQISFPGGKVEKEDRSSKETALRETQEEIGVLREDVRILGRVDDAVTLTSNFVIHPFVGALPYPYEFVLNRDEVKRVITVPLEVFGRNSAEARRDFVQYEGRTYRTAAYEYEGDVIWGATARILENFMDIVGHRLLLPDKKK
jgi:8-oxo-dGTP pyrophosphatase MutT (NUDIX family)